MKVTHYNYGYIFDCVIEGKIAMTRKEWEKAKAWLYAVPKETLAGRGIWRDILLDDLQRWEPYGKKHVAYNIRVPATELLAKKYGLKIKRANYMIIVPKAEPTPAERERLDDLWSQAESVFLEKNDFRPHDWLEGNDLAEFMKLRNLIEGENVYSFVDIKKAQGEKV